MTLNYQGPGPRYVSSGIWEFGGFTVIERGAVLPEWCNKCGAPGVSQANFLLRWLPPNQIKADTLPKEQIPVQFPR